MRLIAVCWVVCCTLLLVAPTASSADNIISRMLRQVLPSAVMMGGGNAKYDNGELSGVDYAPSSSAFGDVDSNDINYVYRKPSRPVVARPDKAAASPPPPKIVAASGGSELPTGEGDTSGWNPFNWFAPKLHNIPYNPDTDLQTVRANQLRNRYLNIYSCGHLYLQTIYIV